MPKLKGKGSFLLFAQVVLISVFAHAFGVIEPAGMEYSGIYQLRAMEPELTGEGIKIASVCRSETYINGEPQNDYLFNIEHNCFIDSKIEFAEGIDFAKGISDHATKIGSILAGYDPNAFDAETGEFKYEGAAYKAEIDVYEFWRFVSTQIYTGEKFDADVLTMSVGTIFDRWWTRGIENYIDKTGLTVVAGIGNGSDVYDPVLYPAAGANVIGVGVIDSTITDFGKKYCLPDEQHSSAGPTGDLRCGPDIVAPGNMLTADANSINGYSQCGDWSSFATPVVSGAVGLLMQKAKSDADLEAAGNNRVMRAILLNSAKKLPYWHKGEVTPEDDHDYPLDFLQGAGAIDAVNAYEHLTAGRWGLKSDGTTGWDDNAIDRIIDSKNIYKIEVDDTKDKYITATLVWNRHYKNEYPFEAKPETNTDLGLEIWAVNGDERTLIDYSDSIDDNIEHVYLPIDPNIATYDIIVKVSGAGDGGEELEKYALAWSIKTPETSEDVWKYDINTDGYVDNDDLDEILNRINEPYTRKGDINLDGVIDVEDVVEILKHLVDISDSETIAQIS